MSIKILILTISGILTISCRGKDQDKHVDSYNTDITSKDQSILITQKGFDIYGYYFPVDTIKYKDYKINGLLIATSDKMDENGENQILYASINILDLKKELNWDLETKDFKFKNKIFQATFKTDSIGVVKITSEFLGNNGPLNDNVTENETIVMKGKFEFNDEYQIETRFTYFAGD